MERRLLIEALMNKTKAKNKQALSVKLGLHYQNDVASSTSLTPRRVAGLIKKVFDRRTPVNSKELVDALKRKFAEYDVRHDAQLADFLGTNQATINQWTNKEGKNLTPLEVANLVARARKQAFRSAIEAINENL